LVTIKQKKKVKIKIEGTCPTHSRTDIVVRDTETTIDEPFERDGTNLGPSPTETALAGLVGCTGVIAQKIARKHGIDVQAMTVGLEATFDRRGVILEEEVEVPFLDITLYINMTTDADDAQVETIKTELAMYCAVSKLFRNAGSTVNEEWTITRPLAESKIA
jgi:uncharacterized OsmC-like protein